MQTTLSRAVPDQTENLTRWLAAIQFICALAFLVDLVLEFPDPRFWGAMTAEARVHLASELTIMLLLIVGFGLARRAHRNLAAQRDRLAGSLRSLRGDFDRILTARFDAWDLTPSQRDVALLCLRGLRIAEIAEVRTCAEGTVKAHMSAVFRAAGVRTRGELVGIFMDEFLDHASATSRQRDRGDLS